jgi:Rad3-related DNA helicase
MIKSIDMSLLETLVVKNFPYSTFNSGQKEVIIDACVSILNGTKHTIISAPTGVGKSVIAITIHKVLEDYKKEFNTVILTTTKGLQDQYKKDFANILLDIKGKNNYPCLKNTQGYSSSGCISALSSKSCEKFKCPYLIARDFWVNHEGVKTTNSSYFLKAPDSKFL